MSKKIDRQEVLRYLGYKGQEVSDDINILIDICREEVINKSNPKYIYEYFNIEEVENEIKVNSTNLFLKGKDIKKHLDRCKEIALLVVTLGLDIEKYIIYNQKIDLTKSIILDACATTYIEEICDMVESEIREEMANKGLSINSRYSPGYGDLPLEMQAEFLNVLNSNKRIGVSTSKHHLLFPRKSVTAIIGITEEKGKIIKRDCSKCMMFSECIYRKGGNVCGDKRINK